MRDYVSYVIASIRTSWKEGVYSEISSDEISYEVRRNRGDRKSVV